ncbi:MAG: amidohydrolase family protein, partial [Chloroflexota bacterium]
CPFTRADKETGLHDFSCIPGGVPSVEIRFPALYSEGVLKERITLNQWVDLCCTTPARLAGLQKKGEIVVGHDADLVVFDPQKEVTIDSESLHENVDWSLYQGKTIQGWPAVTISRGDVIVQDGQFNAEPGRGRFVKRCYD